MSALIKRRRVGASSGQSVCKVPGGQFATLDINVVNVSENIATVSISITDAATPQNGSWVEWNVRLDPNVAPVMRTNEVLAAGETIFIKTDQEVDVRISGFVEDI